MPQAKKERDLVNIQLDRHVHTMLILIRDKYGSDRLSDALGQFIAEKDEQIAEAALKFEVDREKIAGPTKRSKRKRDLG